MMILNSLDIVEEIIIDLEVWPEENILMNMEENKWKKAKQLGKTYGRHSEIV